MSKGSVRRPKQISDEKFIANWERIFGNGKDKQTDSSCGVTVKRLRGNALRGSRARLSD